MMAALMMAAPMMAGVVARVRTPTIRRMGVSVREFLIVLVLILFLLLAAQEVGGDSSTDSPKRAMTYFVSKKTACCAAQKGATKTAITFCSAAEAFSARWEGTGGVLATMSGGGVATPVLLLWVG